MDIVIARTLGLLVVAILVAIVARRMARPYTVGLVLAGATLAFSRINTDITFTHDIIFDLILPPLLFEAALNIHWYELRREMMPVLVLSVGVRGKTDVLMSRLHAFCYARAAEVVIRVWLGSYGCHRSFRCARLSI